MTESCSCRQDCCTQISPTGGGTNSPFVILPAAPQKDAPCCGPPLADPAKPYEMPGYSVCHFVNRFEETPAGRVPVVHTRLTWRDRLGTMRARLGFLRSAYQIAPGLYSTGNPGSDSPVLVTANYKLSFDSLRCHLGVADVWILVCDTRGVNVWCAAGKGTFSGEEVAGRIDHCNLKQIVRHRKLILPQLAATGVSAHRLKQLSGFDVIWGPIRAKDIPEFLKNGMKGDESMRRVTFSLTERLVLTPVELSLLAKPLAVILAAVFLFSGIGPGVFSVHAAWARGLAAFSAFVLGVIAGTIATPLLLPWIPGTPFALKGMIVGLFFALLLPKGLSFIELSARILVVITASSYLAMNFTGSTPFTSPSGVEKEMRWAIPLQLLGMIAAAVLWMASPFL